MVLDTLWVLSFIQNVPAYVSRHRLGVFPTTIPAHLHKPRLILNRAINYQQQCEDTIFILSQNLAMPKQEYDTIFLIECLFRIVVCE